MPLTIKKKVVVKKKPAPTTAKNAQVAVKKDTKPFVKPSLYKAKYVDAIQAYIQYCWKNTHPTFVMTGKMPKKKGQFIPGYNWNSVEIPTIYGFSKYLGVHRSTLYNWAKEHTNFARALEDLKEEEKDMMIKCGLGGYFNSRMALMLLNVNHGMVPKQELDTHNEHFVAAMFAVHDRAEEMRRELKELQNE